MKYNTLYKIAKNKKIQTWTIELSDNKYRTITGFEDGEKVTSNWTECKGKNIGRSNETTPDEQAKLEVEALYQKKLDQNGYHTSKNNAKKGTAHIVPMLAKEFDDVEITKEQYESGYIWCQPKLDGVRCIATKDGLFSRNGKKFKSCPHIEKELASIFKEHPSLILDGELYADKFKDNFNDIIRLVRKEKDIDEDLCKSIEYHIYDTVELKLNFQDRLDKYLRPIIKPSKYIKLVETHNPLNLNELNSLYEYYINCGYEGQMIRLNEKYENTRTKSLLKRKTFQDDEFEIIDIIEGEGNRSGMAGKILYRLKSGETNESGIRGDVSFFKELLNNKHKYIGGIGTVRFFGYTEKGKLRFPVTVAVYKSTKDL